MKKGQMKGDRQREVIILPPRFVLGMEKALPDYSERLARRTGAIANVTAARFDDSNHTDHTESRSQHFSPVPVK